MRQLACLRWNRCLLDRDVVGARAAAQFADITNDVCATRGINYRGKRHGQVIRHGKDEEMVPMEAVGCMLAGGWEGKMEILGKSERERKVRREQKGPRVRQRSVQQQQRDAAAQGRAWVKCTCTGCGAQVPVHVKWRKPLVMCKECRAKRRRRLLAAHAQSCANKALSPRMPAGGWPVGGGLPSLGKRR